MRKRLCRRGTRVPFSAIQRFGGLIEALLSLWQAWHRLRSQQRPSTRLSFPLCWVTCRHFVSQLDICLHFLLHFLSDSPPAPGRTVVFTVATTAAAAATGRHHIPGIARPEWCLEIQRPASVGECHPHRVPLSLWSPASSHFIWVSYLKPMLSVLLAAQGSKHTLHLAW